MKQTIIFDVAGLCGQRVNPNADCVRPCRKNLGSPDLVQQSSAHNIIGYAAGCDRVHLSKIRSIPQTPRPWQFLLVCRRELIVQPETDLRPTEQPLFQFDLVRAIGSDQHG